MRLDGCDFLKSILVVSVYVLLLQRLQGKSACGGVTVVCPCGAMGPISAGIDEGF